MNSAGATTPNSKISLLAIGFGTSVTMWAVAYFCRLPAVMAPSWLVLVLMFVCLTGGGFFAGKYTGDGRAGVWTGILTAVINLLVLGSLLGGDEPNRVVPSAVWWVPGSILVSAVLGAVGGTVGAQRPVDPAKGPDWTSVFARVAAVATFLLLMVGGVVTSKDAGLAVVDWPNSFGYNMFLYPLSKMIGGIYYEHAHRLFGSLVGLTTLVLTILLWVTPNSKWLRGFSLLALATVILQGILGGLRVTGHFTLSSSAVDMTPSRTLAAFHGILGQVFLGMMVAIAVLASGKPREDRPGSDRAAGPFDRTVTVVLIGILFVQVVSGAILRHGSVGLLAHITLAVVVLPIAVTAGARVWRAARNPLLQRTGRLLIILTGVQLVLGLLAFSAVSQRPITNVAGSFEVITTTAHQAGGALLVACAVTLMIWSYRLWAVQPARAANG